MKKIKDKEREKYLKDCQYIGQGCTVDLTLQGYNCRVTRHKTLGILCGYVILEDDKEIYENTLNLLEVHGGITYNRIEIIKDTNRRVIGFDCVHFDDYIPCAFNPYLDSDTKYRDFKFVRKELIKLIDQLKKAGIK